MNTSTPSEHSSTSMAARDPVQADLPRDPWHPALISLMKPGTNPKILTFPLLSSDIDQIPADPDRPRGKLIEFRLPQE
jgi:hypothetical protein